MDKLDLVLLMSVNPASAARRSSRVVAQGGRSTGQGRRLIRASGREIMIEIDGGVKVDNIADIARAGADTVAGSAIFGAPDAGEDMPCAPHAR